MKVEMKQSMQIPEDKTFVDEFTVSYGENGLEVKCKSVVFAAWIKSIRSSTESTKIDLNGMGYAPEQVAFDVDGREFYNAALDNQYELAACLNPVQQFLLNKDAAGMGANLSFLLLPGLEEGVSLTARLPVSIADAHDYYYGCLQAFQNIYLDFVRPFNVTAVLKEVEE